MEALTANRSQKRRRRVKLDSDVERGDPAQLVLGKDDEKPARVHKPLPKKWPGKRSPARMAMDELRKDIGLMNELDQYARACEAQAAREQARAKRARAAIKVLEVKGE